MAKATRLLDRARKFIQRMRDTAQKRDDDLDAIDIAGRTQDWVNERRAQIRMTALEQLTSLYDEARNTLDEAEAAAAAELAGSPDTAAEIRRSRSTDRVVRMLEGNQPVEVAGVLAGAGDVDGLRALREELPTYLQRTMNPASWRDAATRTRTIASQQLMVDRALRELLVGSQRDAIDAALSVDAVRRQLHATWVMLTQPNRGFEAAVQLQYAKADDFAAESATTSRS
ncbi:MAG: hypothetical protein JO214_14595 [Frankiaceae bacterium]|nr:hypothetical protein [Frankiaceae bacterium]